ncbi:MAG: hypothetical protein MJ082_03670, partial [Clostridia bacterium]|nr:hypothetical protein [Clostridia bacterium]
MENTIIHKSRIFALILAIALCFGLLSLLTVSAAADAPAAPEGVGVTHCTTDSNNNGTLTGVTSAMEYSTDEEVWTPITGTTVTGLVPGVYFVRYAETGSQPASASVSVEIYQKLSGTLLNVSGFKSVGNTCKATLNKPNTDHEITYKWFISGVVVAEGPTYTLTEADYNRTLQVRAYSDNRGGSVASTAVTVNKGQPAAPTGQTATDCTTADNNDGKILGVTTDMEYHVSGSSDWYPITSTEITGLAPGTYHVRYKESDCYSPSPNSQDLVIGAYVVPVAHTVTVNGGTADKAAAFPGETVTVTAGEPPKGFLFNKWIGYYLAPLADENAAVTTFVMPDADVIVYANFETPAPLTATIVISGTPIVGNKLSASVPETNSTVGISVQWYRGSTPISGATSTVYTLTEEDIGYTLTLHVSSKKQTGEVISEGKTVEKSSVAKPAGIFATACKTVADNEGKIQGVTTAMEYRKSGTAAWTDVPGSEISGLSSGTYEIRVKETATSYASETVEITVNPAQKYQIIYENAEIRVDGVEEAIAAPGAIVTVVANEAPSGSVLDELYLIGATPLSSSETELSFVMPENNVTVNAVYAIPVTSVEITCHGYTAGGNIADAVPVCNNENVAIAVYFWFDNATGAVLTDGIFLSEKQYALAVYFYPIDGYTLKNLEKNNVSVLGKVTADFENPMEEEAFEGLSKATQNPDPLAKVVSGISITAAPTRTAYTESENFDSTGMTVTATYTDGTTATVSATVTDGENLTAGKTSVTVSYTLNGVTKTAAQTIAVAPKPVLTFDANGGLGEMAPVAVFGEYTLPACTFTAPRGKMFKCWDVDSIELASGEKMRVTETQTVKAVWVTDPTAPAVPESTDIHTENNTVSVTVSEQTASEIGVDMTEIFASAKTAGDAVKVNAGTVSVTFDAAAVNAIAGAEAALKVETTAENAAAKVPDAKLVIEITLDGATFQGGSATVKLPFTQTVPEGKVAKVYYVDGEGNKTDMNAALENGEIVFTTNHFSTYAVLFENLPAPETPEGPATPANPAAPSAPNGLSAGAVALIAILSVLTLRVGVYFALGFTLYKEGKLT